MIFKVEWFHLATQKIRANNGKRKKTWKSNLSVNLGLKNNWICFSSSLCFTGSPSFKYNKFSIRGLLHGLRDSSCTVSAFLCSSWKAFSSPETLGQTTNFTTPKLSETCFHDQFHQPFLVHSLKLTVQQGEKKPSHLRQQNYQLSRRSSAKWTVSRLQQKNAKLDRQPKKKSAQKKTSLKIHNPPPKKKTVHLLFGFNPRHAHLGTKLLLFHPALGTGLGRAS